MKAFVFIFTFCLSFSCLAEITELPLVNSRPLTLITGNWKFRESAGHYRKIKTVENRCHQSYIQGNQVKFKDCPFTVEISKNANHYVFSTELGDRKLDAKIILHFKKDKNEIFYGAGTQYTHLSLNGKKFELLSQEQGVGRGIQPISFLQEILRPGLSGNAITTYASSPIIFSSKKYSLVFDSYHYGTADFSGPGQYDVSFLGNRIKVSFYSGQSWTELFEKTSSETGRMRALPAWIQQGAIIGLMGGKKTVNQKLDKIQKVGASIAGVWLQDWVGKRDTILGTRLKWDWQLEKSSYPSLDFGVPFLGYFNPYLTDIPEGPERKSILLQAKKNGYLVKVGKEYYRSMQGGFHGYLVDLLNPKAFAWLKGLMIKQIKNHHFKGWMADFSENYPIKSTGELHHLYIEKWIQLNREIVDELEPKKLTFFNRASHLKVPGYSTLFWLGDQTSTWDKFDGLHSSLIGLLTSGLSGNVFNHSDIGGYVSIKFSPLLNISRDKELLYRWMELNAFTAIFRTHLGLNPQLAKQVYEDDETLDAFAHWSKIYKGLYDYKKSYVKLASEKGTPLVRPLFINFPDDPLTYTMDDQFMLGDEILVAPVMQPEMKKRKVYLPRGQWTHLWTNKKIESSGEYLEIDSPLGMPPVFLASHFPEKLQKQLQSLGHWKNKPQKITQVIPENK